MDVKSRLREETQKEFHLQSFIRTKTLKHEEKVEEPKLNPSLAEIEMQNTKRSTFCKKGQRENHTLLKSIS